ncbi:MAG: RagB/SusD family nutrient uptake outer membrane protein [Cyclobacteriaceae bacterium]
MKNLKSLAIINMKTLKYITTIIVVTTIFFFSCDEDQWLNETPLDFYSPENSYQTPAQFNSAVARLYGITNQYMMWGNTHTTKLLYDHTSDLAYDAIATTHELNSYVDALTPQHRWIENVWDRYYDVIFNANVILSRIDDVEFASEDQRERLKAEAMFFRAYMYRNLGIQFGGVPIVLEEINEPKRDFTRATREAVYEQAISDLEFAAANLPHVSELTEDGRLTEAAANHLLSELYIIVNDYDAAISAASSVIDDPSYALNIERFGVHQDWDGDVYWDLFRRGNQNRHGTGGFNPESIWVAQYEYLTPAGGQGNNNTRFVVPEYWRLSGSDGVPLFFGHSEKYGGRGIGWATMTDYFFDLWEDPNDIRNSEHNILYDIEADNPESAFYGQKIVESGAIDDHPNRLQRQWSAILAKTAPLNDFPPEVVDDPETGATNNAANRTFRDHYYMRLAETYLLRAEAHLGNGNSALAAADINVVRERANASPVTPGEVDIDYILDERARELHLEDYRILTLMRLGVLAERVREHDPMHNGKYASHGVSDHHNLWPIPQKEIERNTEAVLEQNPGYN